MTLLLPSLQAERIRRSIVDYLSTTFALTDAEPRRVLTDFLEDEKQGVFVGPFVRLRLPYLAASARPGTTDPAHPTDRPLDWDPGLTPYQHQEDSYRRLTTKGGHRPEPRLGPGPDPLPAPGGLLPASDHQGRPPPRADHCHHRHRLR